MTRTLRLRALVALGALSLLALVVPASPAVAATTTRLGGTDRYDTAAKVSKQYFASGVPVAYVASGESFPDALAAGPAAAAGGGPVLLTQKDGIPPATATELTRLHPAKIIEPKRTYSPDWFLDWAFEEVQRAVAPARPLWIR